MRQVMDAINARDFDALASVPFDEEFEFHSRISVSEGDTYRGMDGLREWAADVDEVFEDFHAAVTEVQAADDRAVVVFHVTGRARGSGVPLDVRLAQVWTWREGKLWRNVAYSDREEAMRAAGVG